MTETKKGFHVAARQALKRFENERQGTVDFGVLAVFVAKIEAALPLRRVVAIASALEDRQFPAADVQAVLTKMVRLKILRSRRIRGETFYEVNA